MKTIIKPVFSVRNGIAAIDFYCKVFGTIERIQVASRDGRLEAELHIDTPAIFCADESLEHGNDNPELNIFFSVISRYHRNFR